MNMNISQQIKDIKLPDLPQAIKDLKFWYSATNPYTPCDGGGGPSTSAGGDGAADDITIL